MTKEILSFLTFCVGLISLKTELPRSVVYQKLMQADMIYNYIVPCFDVLHTLGREYLEEDFIELMKERGVL